MMMTLNTKMNNILGTEPKFTKFSSVYKTNLVKMIVQIALFMIDRAFKIF